MSYKVYLEDLGAYVQFDADVPHHEAIRQIQSDVYGIATERTGLVEETAKSFANSLVRQAGIVGLVINDLGNKLQYEPLKSIAGYVGEGASIPIEKMGVGIEAALSPQAFVAEFQRKFYEVGRRELPEESHLHFMSRAGQSLSTTGKDIFDAVNAFADNIFPKDMEVWQGDFSENPSWTRAIAGIAGALPDLFASLTIGIVTKSPYLPSMILGGKGGLTLALEARESGVEYERSADVALAYGTASAVLNSIPLSRYLNNLKGIGSVGLSGSGVASIAKLGAKEGLIGGLQEMVIEGTEQLIQNMVAKAGWDTTRRWFEGIIDSMIAGLGSGMVAGSTSAVAGKMFHQDTKTMKDVGIGEAELSSLIDVVTEQIVDNADTVQDVITEKVSEGLNHVIENAPATEVSVDPESSPVEQAVQTLVGEIDPTNNFAKAAENLIVKNTVESAARDYGLRQIRPDRIFRMFDKFQDGVFTKKVWDPIVESYFKSVDLNSKIRKDLYGILSNYYSFVAKNRGSIGQVQIGKKSVNVTADMAAHVYANSFNTKNRAKLRRSGLTDVAIHEISNMLPDNIKANFESLFEYFDNNTFPELARVFSEINEGKVLPKEEFYFPIKDLEDAGTLESVEIDFSERFGKEYVSKEISEVKERVGGAEGFLRFSFDSALSKMVDNVSHYISSAKAINEASKILLNRNVKKAIRQKYGNEMVRIVDKWLQDTSFGGYKPATTTLDKVSRFLRTNPVMSALGFNLNSVARQPASFLQGSNMIGLEASTMGLEAFMHDPRGVIKIAEEKSLIIRHRDFSQERELVEIMKGRRIAGSKVFGVTPEAGFSAENVASFIQFAREGGMKPMMFTDKMTVVTLWTGEYLASKKRGMSEAQAVKRADNVIIKTQPMGGVIFTPDDFRGNALSQLFTVFRNQQNQNLNILFDAVGELGAKKHKTVGDYVNAGKGIALMTLGAGLWMGIISRKRIPTPGEFAQDAIMQPLGGAVFLGNIVDSILSAMNGDAWRAAQTLAPFGLGTITSRPAEIIMRQSPEAKLAAFAKMVADLAGIPQYPFKIDKEITAWLKFWESTADKYTGKKKKKGRRPYGGQITRGKRR